MKVKSESEVTQEVSDSSRPHGLQPVVIKLEDNIVDIFLELSCFFHDPMDVSNLISGSSGFSKTSLNIWKFAVHVLLKPGLDNFEGRGIPRGPRGTRLGTGLS